MKTLKFKTTIKCSGCIEKVTPELNSVAGINHWEVNTQIPDKILTVSGQVEEQTVIAVLAGVGYQATPC